jgi:hypothetical protein
MQLMCPYLSCSLPTFQATSVTEAIIALIQILLALVSTEAEANTSVCYGHTYRGLSLKSGFGYDLSKGRYGRSLDCAQS